MGTKVQQVEVIRVIKYVGSEQAVRAALAMSLPEGIRDVTTYQIHVATHSSNLPPLIELPDEEVQAVLVGVAENERT